MLSDIAVLLNKNEQHLTKLHLEVWPSLVEADEISDDALYLVRSVLQDCLSALDMLATAIDQKYGKAGDRSPYYPLMPTAVKFDEQFAKHFRGVREKAPSVYYAMGLHQPYTPGHEDLGLIHELARINKHQRFTRQVNKRTKRGEINFGPMSLVSEPDHGARPLYGHPIGDGHSLSDDEVGLSIRAEEIVTWMFADYGDLPVHVTIWSIHRLVGQACIQICQVASL